MGLGAGAWLVGVRETDLAVRADGEQEDIYPTSKPGGVSSEGNGLHPWEGTVVNGPLSGELGPITGLEQDRDVFTGGPVFVDQDLLPSLADLLTSQRTVLFYVVCYTLT